MTGNLWDSATQRHRQQSSSLRQLEREQITFPNLTKYKLDVVLRCWVISWDVEVKFTSEVIDFVILKYL